MKAVVYGVLLEDAETNWPGRNQLVLALSEHLPVVLLERSPKQLVPRRPRLEEIGPNLFAVRKAMSVRTHRLGRRQLALAARVDGRWLRQALSAAGLQDHLLWLTVADPVLALGTPDECLIYDCMDPNFLPEGQDRFDRDELALAARAKLVFASANTLLARVRAVNSRSFLLPNASPEPTLAELPEPAALAGRPRPIVGYMGTIDWRFDANAIEAAATRLPLATFVLVGRVNHERKADAARLARLPNVVLTGQVPGKDAEALNRSFDVGLIPFVPSATNDAINPVKMFMYLAHGLPVVSTWIAECCANPLVTTTRTDQAFAAAVEAALAECDAALRQERLNFAAENTWSKRAAEAIAILRTQGLID